MIIYQKKWLNQLGKSQFSILDILARHDGPMTSTEIGDILYTKAGRPVSQACRQLKVLEEKKCIESPGTVHAHKHGDLSRLWVPTTKGMILRAQYLRKKKDLENENAK